MNTKKRILSLVLALVMIFGAFAPVVAQAKIGEGKEQGIVNEPSKMEVKNVVFEVRNQDDKAVKNPFQLMDEKGAGHVSVLYKDAMNNVEKDITAQLDLARLDETDKKVYRKYNLTRKDGKAFGHGEYIIVVKGYTSARFTITKEGISEKDLFVAIKEDRGNLKINAVGDDYKRLSNREFVIAKPLIKQETKKAWVKKLVGNTVKVVQEDVTLDNIVMVDGVPQISKTDKEVYLRKTNEKGSTFASFDYSADGKGAVVTGAEDGRYNQEDYDWLVADLNKWIAIADKLEKSNYLTEKWVVLEKALKDAKAVAEQAEKQYKDPKAPVVVGAKQVREALMDLVDAVHGLNSLTAQAKLEKLVKDLYQDILRGEVLEVSTKNFEKELFQEFEKLVKSYLNIPTSGEATFKTELVKDEAVAKEKIKELNNYLDALTHSKDYDDTLQDAEDLVAILDQYIGQDGAKKDLRDAVEAGKKLTHLEKTSEAIEVLQKAMDAVKALKKSNRGLAVALLAEANDLSQVDPTLYVDTGNEYTTAKNALDQAVIAATQLNENFTSDSTPEYSNLENAVENFKKLEKTQAAKFDEALQEAKELVNNLGQYIGKDGIKKNLRDAVKAADQITDSKKKTEDETKKLTEAIAAVKGLDGFKPYEPSTPVDVTNITPSAFKELVEGFKGIYNNLNKSLYTVGSLEAFKAEIDKAEALLEKVNPTTEELVDAYKVMLNARENLVLVETSQIFVNYGEKLVVYPKGEPEKAQLWNPWVTVKEVKFYDDLKESAINPHKFFRLKESDELNFFWMTDTNITLRVRVETVDEKPVRQAEIEVGLPKEYTKESAYAMGEIVAKGKTDDGGYVEFTLPREQYVKLVGTSLEGNVLENPEDERVVAQRRYLPYLVRQVDTGIEEGVIKSDEIFNVAVDAELVAGERIYELYIENKVDLGKETGRIGGANRYETAVRVAHKAFPKGLEFFDNYTNLVISSGENYPDSLTASTTAYNYSAPLLLTQKAELPKETLDYIKSNLVGQKAPRVIIVGGEATVTDEVVNEIKGLGIDVLRISGKDRYATSVENAKALVSLAGNNHDQLMKGFKGTERKVVIASGENFPDALAIASPAANAGYPLLLTKKDEVPAVVREFLKEANAKTADVIGGEASVSEKAVKQLRDDYLNLTVARVAGSDRTETSIAIAKKYYADATHVFVTSGAGFADALTGGTYAAKEGSPVILLPNADTVSEDVVSFIKDSKLTSFTILGGSGTVSEAARRAVSDTILNK